MAKSILKGAIGESRYDALVTGYYEYQNALEPAAAALPSEAPELEKHDWDANLERMASYKDKHNGERCFIIGNGPSLLKTDLTLLKDEYTFGVNRIYIYYDKMGFEPTYFVTINKNIIEQFSDDIMGLSSPKFLNWRCREFIEPADDIVFFTPRDHVARAPWFAHDVANKMCSGGTVTNVNLQLAYYMGFRQVILVGVDHDYASKGEPNKAIVSEGNDPDHFDPNYYHKGHVFQLPDYVRCEMSFALAKYQYRLGGGEILDATIGGKLDVFPKVNYAEFLKA